MPIVVPTYEQQVGDQAPTGARLSGSVPSGAFGGGVAQSVGQLGQSVSQAAQIQDQLDAQHDETMAKSIALRGLTNIQNTLYGTDQQAGYLSLQKSDALSARDSTQQSILDYNDELLGQAQNARQRAFLQTNLATQTQGAFDTIGKHAVAEAGAWSQAQSAATIAGDRSAYTNAAIAAASSTDAGTTAQLQQNAAVSYAKMGAEISRNLKQTGMYSDETYQEELQKQATLAHKAVLDNLLNSGTKTGIAAANIYFAVHGGEMDPDTRPEYELKVRQAVTMNSAADAMDAALAHGSVGAGAGAPSGSMAVQGPVADQNRSLVAQAGGTPDEQNTLAMIGQLENPSGANIKNPSQGATSYGRWQINDATWKDLHGSMADRDDPQAQAGAALKNLRQNNVALTNGLGRAPSPMETYLGWQQGPKGALALLKADPNETAVQALQDAGIERAQASITANLPPSIRALGSRVTVGQFLQTWGSNVSGQAGSAATTPGVSPALNPSTGAFIGTLPDKSAAVKSAMAFLPPNADAATVQAFTSAAEARYTQASSAQQSNENVQNQQVAGIYLDGSLSSWADVQKSGRLVGLDNVHQEQVMAHYGGDKSFATEDVPKTLQALHQSMVDNKYAFARTDMTQFADQLTPSTFKEMLNQQDRIKRGDSGADQKIETVSSIMSATNAMLRSAGVVPINGKENQDQADQLARYQQAMTNWADLKERASGKPPTPEEIQKRAGQLLTMQVQTRQNAGFLTAPSSSAPEPFLKANPTNQNFVPISQIPVPVQKQISAGFARRNGGRLPTSQQVENAYVDFVTRGVY